MTWYYLDPKGERTAVEEKDLAVLVGAGSIHARTLVWRKGQKEWLSCGEVRPELFHPGHGGLAGADLGRSEVAALVSAAGLRSGEIRWLGWSLFLFAAVLLISLFLIPACWIPILAGRHYLRAANCLESAGRTGEIHAWRLYGKALRAAGLWLRVTLVTVGLVGLGLVGFGFLIKSGVADVPEWMMPTVDGQSVRAEKEER